MTPHRLPRAFGLSPKPHITKYRGEWIALWPDNWPVPASYEQDFGPFLRRINGITPWRPTSTLYHVQARLQ